MLEVRWHKAEHVACSWIGFAHRGGVSIIFLFLFCVFYTHGLRVNHLPLSDVCLLHTRVVCQHICTHGLSYSMIVYTHLPNTQHASNCFQAMFLYVCVDGHINASTD